MTKYAIEMDGLYDLDFSVTEEKLELFPAALVYNNLKIITDLYIMPWTIYHSDSFRRGSCSQAS